MRIALIVLIASALAAGEAAAPAAVPAAAQKLVDTSVEVAVKAHEAYRQAVKKEQDKLIAALQKEQEKATKKGDLDAALAIKAQIEAVQTGLLLRESAKATDLLGDATGPAAAANVPASLASDCPTTPETVPPEGAPKELEAVLRRCSRITFVKGDRTRYTFTCSTTGMVVVNTGPGPRPHAEIWADLQKAGFRRLEGEGSWWVLDAKPGHQFPAYDPVGAGAATSVYALRFTRAR